MIDKVVDRFSDETYYLAEDSDLDDVGNLSNPNITTTLILSGDLFSLEFENVYNVVIKGEVQDGYQEVDSVDIVDSEDVKITGVKTFLRVEDCVDVDVYDVVGSISMENVLSSEVSETRHLSGEKFYLHDVVNVKVDDCEFFNTSITVSSSRNVYISNCVILSADIMDKGTVYSNRAYYGSSFNRTSGGYGVNFFSSTESSVKDSVIDMTGEEFVGGMCDSIGVNIRGRDVDIDIENVDFNSTDTCIMISKRSSNRLKDCNIDLGVSVKDVTVREVDTFMECTVREHSWIVLDGISTVNCSRVFSNDYDNLKSWCYYNDFPMLQSIMVVENI